jgi:hypothetical protein
VSKSGEIPGKEGCQREDRFQGVGDKERIDSWRGYNERTDFYKERKDSWTTRGLIPGGGMSERGQIPGGVVSKRGQITGRGVTKR